MKTFLFAGFFFCLIQPGLMAASQWFSAVQKNPDFLQPYCSRSVVFTIDRDEVKKVFRQDPSSLEIEIPFPDGNKVIAFQQTDIHAPGFQVLNAAGRDVTASLEMPLHFRGKNNRKGKELASLSLFSDGNFVLVFSGPAGNVNVAALPEKFSSAPDQYVAFLDSDLKKKNPFHCGIDHDGPVPANPAGSSTQPDQIQNDSTCRLTEIYWECDHDMYQKGGDLQGTLNRFEAMFTGTAVLYEIETINIGVKAVKVWDTPDPYTYTSSFAALDDFLSAGNAANWPGQLAHLLSTRPLNLGGVAYLNALCSSFRYGFSNIDFLFPELPVYSWTLSTIAHELGHNFASNHTHNCGWEVQPGIFQQIDSCWDAEGGCQPTIKGRIGTIMSYCHLTGSVNLSLGFGVLPGNRIRAAYAAMPCVAGTIVIPNYTPGNSGPFCNGDTVQLLAEDLPGYSYNWTGPNGFSSSERSPLLPNLSEAAEGEYKLSIRKLACTSREKKTSLIFNCMKIGSLPASICAGSDFTIPFSSTGNFNPGNKFIAQLSNNAGSFSNPINLDTLESSQPQAMRVFLPAGLAMGTAYKIRLLSTSPAYTGKPQVKSLGINPIGTPPLPVNGERCGSGSVQISANGGSNLIWTSSLAETVPVFQGRKFTTPVITQTSSWFVQSGGSSRSEAGLKTPSGNLNATTQEDGIAFESFATFRLDSISLFHEPSSTQICEIVLRKEGAEIYSRIVSNLAGSTQTKVPLFWRVNPGHGYQLLCRNIGTGLKRSTVAYPLKVSNLISLESSVSASGDYPYLFNWVIAKYSGCPSRKVEVQARILNGIAPPAPEIQAISDSLFFPVSAPVYEWTVNGQVQLNYNFPKIRALLNSAYQVRYKLDSCWSDFSDPYVVTAQTKISEKAEGFVSFYPNPVERRLFWRSALPVSEIAIYSTDGRQILLNQTGEKESMDLSFLPDGLYFIHWRSGAESGMLRMSVLK